MIEWIEKNCFFRRNVEILEVRLDRYKFEKKGVF